MKILKKFNLKKTLLACLTACASACLAIGIGILMPAMPTPEAKADGTVSSTVFQTDGASVRVFKWNGSAYEDTDKKGIRFHVEMGAGYQVGGSSLLAQKNQNGRYTMAAGYKSYTLILPTRLLSGELTTSTDKVMAIETTDYWYSDDDGNWESVAYIHSIPEKWYTDEFTYRGIIVSVDAQGNETLVVSTPVQTRSLAWVAKQAYLDTIAADYYWGSSDLDDTAAPEIKKLFPVYNVIYGNGQTEEVLWGDKLTRANKDKIYYDETNQELVEVELPLEMAIGGKVILEEVTRNSFVLTGVQYTTTGFNVYATLPVKNFSHGLTLNASAVDMVTSAGVAVEAKSVSVSVAGTGLDAVSQLQMSFSYDSISYGTALTILKSSNFYNDGALYELAEDYQFIFYNQAWELPLGSIVRGDIDTITNYPELNEKHIRIEFHGDILVNGPVTFRKLTGSGLEPGGVTITRKSGAVETITDGYYYWNQGAESILEIPGSSNLWGDSEGDVLTIAKGTRVYQNGGFYEVSEDITAEFNGDTDWLFDTKETFITAADFTAVYTRQEGDRIYIDANTREAWADHMVNVVTNNGTLTYHDTDNVTEVDPTRIEYHGEGGNKILRIFIERFSLMGDWVSIPKGTSFWVGNNVYTLTEDVTSYFVIQEASWITNPSLQMVDQDSIASMHWEASNQCLRLKTSESWSSILNNRVVVDDTYFDGEGVIVEGSNYSGFYYYGAGHNLLELRGANFSEQGGLLTIKAGTFLWLFNNVDLSFTGAYLFEEDVSVKISGAYGSQIYQEKELITLYRSDVRTVEDNFDIDAVNGEVRLWLQPSVTGAITESGSYCPMFIEGNANVDGITSTLGQCYGTNKLIAVLGVSGRGREAGATFTLEAGTKLYLHNSIGYILIGEDIQYRWNGSAWYAYEQSTVNFNANNATFKVDGSAVTSKVVYKGSSVTFSVEGNPGYFVTGVNGATKNNDGTYTVLVDGNKTVTVTAVPKIHLDASAITLAELYDERSAGAHLMGVRLHIDGNSEFKNLTAVYYGLKTTQEATTTVSGGVTRVSAFGGHNLFELCFEIANLKNGDQFKIAAGSVFYADNAPYAIEWTEDIVATWFDGWMLERTNMGLLDWNTVGIEQVYSYSDFQNGQQISSTIRINLNNALFGGASGSGGILGNITIDGQQYTGTSYYHGDKNKILQISEWNYAKGQTLVIEAGTKIIIGMNYYITKNTLTATCKDNGSGAQWEWTVS